MSEGGNRAKMSLTGVGEPEKYILISNPTEEYIRDGILPRKVVENLVWL